MIGYAAQRRRVRSIMIGSGSTGGSKNGSIEVRGSVYEHNGPMFGLFSIKMCHRRYIIHLYAAAFLLLAVVERQLPPPFAFWRRQP